MKSSIAALALATSFLVGPGLHLTVQPVAADAPAVAERRSTNWIIACDCSGSMSGQLPRIGGHLKAKLAKLLEAGDTCSLVWFSGRGETDTIFKGELVAGPADLQGIGKMIDRWLRPVGLTAFVDPLKLLKTMVKEFQKATPKSANAVIFITDGDDNQYGRAEILKAVRELAEEGAALTLVEYGYYCNRPLMAQMAEAGGAALIFADGFMSYEPLIEAALKKAVTGAKKRTISVPNNATGGFAYGFSGADLVTFAIEQDQGPNHGDIQVPEDIREVFFLSPVLVGKEGRPLESLARMAAPLGGVTAPVTVGGPLAGALAGVALFGQRMNPDVVLPLLRALGDVSLIRLYQGAFTIQSYQSLVVAATEAANGKGRFTAGYDPKAVPADNCPTIFDLLDILDQGKARIRIEDLIKSYERIGRATGEATFKFTDEMAAALAAQAPGLAPLALFDGASSVEAYAAALEEHTKKSVAALAAVKTLLAGQKNYKFVADPCPEGVTINSLVYSQDRANLSVSVSRDGGVDLGEDAPQFAVSTAHTSLPQVFRTRITRSYSVIVDGTVNIKSLPVIVDFVTYDRLRAAGFVPASPMQFIASTKAIDIDLTVIPVLNREMVGSVLAADLFRDALTLYRAKCEAAVLNNYLAAAFVKVPAPKLAALYGEDAAAWLSSIGVKDYGWDDGAPPAPKVDFYMAQIAKVSLKGLSKVPGVGDAREALTAFDKATAAYEANKTAKGAKPPKAMPLGISIMVPFLRELDAHVASTAALPASDRDAAIKSWVDARLAAAEKVVDTLALASARARFSLVLGRKWPSDLGDVTNKDLPVKLEDKARGLTYETIGTLELVEKKIDI